MRIALHMRVRGDRIGDLFHLIDCADYPAMLAALNTMPVHIEWQARMAELLDPPHDYSAAGADAGLPVVWQP